MCGCRSDSPFLSADASAQTYEVTKLVPGSAFHGVHGLGIDKAGRMFAGSVAGAALYEVDLKNGTAKIAIPTPEGMADDIAFAPDGTMAWTGFLTGDLYSRKGDGPIKKLASGLPGINSLAYRKDGRLYATTVFLGDTLYEIDVEGVKPPRMIMEKMGGLNGFEFGPDDMLYGPLWFKGQVVKVDVDKPELTVVADGFKTPAAVNFDSKGNLWVVDTATRPAGSGRSQNRREEDRRAAQALARQSRDRRQGSHLRLQHGGQWNPGGRCRDRRRQADHHRQAGAARRHRRRLRQWQGHHLRRRRVRLSHRGRHAPAKSPNRRGCTPLGVTLEYPMSATAKGDDVILSSWFTGTVQVIDRKTGATREMLHGFKAPHDAIRLDDGSFLVNELGTKSLVRASGEHGKDRSVVIGDLAGPVGLVGGPKGCGLCHRSLFGTGLEGRRATAKEPWSPRT